MSRHLFRLDMAGAPLANALAQGLRRHLQHADLLTCLVRIDQRKQAYVALDGCPNCPTGRCVPGCRVELLRRAVRVAFGPAAQLRPVPKGLADRPYTRLALALPSPRAQPLDGDLLASWAEARLILHWHRAGKGRLSVAAALAAGVGGPEPAAALLERGWRLLPVPTALLPAALKLVGAALPPRLPIARRWPGDPSLLVAALPPRPMPELETAASVVLAGAQATSEDANDQARLRQSAYLHLRAIMAGKSKLSRSVKETPLVSSPSEGQPTQDGAEGWPAGPGEGRAAMAPADVRALLLAALAAPTPGDGAEPGLTRRRISALLGERHKEHALALLLWLERAGLLETPADPSQPYRKPRPLAETDVDALAARLMSTPRPSAAELSAAKASGL